MKLVSYLIAVTSLTMPPMLLGGCVGATRGTSSECDGDVPVDVWIDPSLPWNWGSFRVDDAFIQRFGPDRASGKLRWGSPLEFWEGGALRAFTGAGFGGGDGMEWTPSYRIGEAKCECGVWWVYMDETADKLRIIKCCNVTRFVDAQGRCYELLYDP